MTGFSYVVDERISLMMRNNLPKFCHWYIREIILRIRPRPWAALRLFILMPFALLRMGFMIPAVGKTLIMLGGWQS